MMKDRETTGKKVYILLTVSVNGVTLSHKSRVTVTLVNTGLDLMHAPTAMKRKSPDDQPPGGESVKRVRLNSSEVLAVVEEDEQPEEVQQVAKPPTKPKRRRIKKLVPPRPFSTVPASASATGPRSAHSEGKNYICVTRKTPLAAYLRRCKSVILDDG